jgi:hypothetical protein
MNMYSGNELRSDSERLYFVRFATLFLASLTHTSNCLNAEKDYYVQSSLRVD